MVDDVETMYRTVLETTGQPGQRGPAPVEPTPAGVG
jgi:hypothetical protein